MSCVRRLGLKLMFMIVFVKLIKYYFVFGSFFKSGIFMFFISFRFYILLLSGLEFKVDSCLFCFIVWVFGEGEYGVSNFLV